MLTEPETISPSRDKMLSMACTASAGKKIHALLERGDVGDNILGQVGIQLRQDGNQIPGLGKQQISEAEEPHGQYRYNQDRPDQRRQRTGEG